MTTRTYHVYGRGSVGPAHPNYRPDVNVTVLEDGATVQRIAMPSNRAGHRWALEQGLVLDESQAHIADQPWYETLKAEIRYAESGL